jgi:iron complex outermembrane receptor protein
VEVETYAGSLSTRGARVSFGRLFGQGDELLIAASGFRSSGSEHLYFPEFADTPTGGIATGLDDDESSNVFGSFAHGRVTIRGGLAYRDKEIPTGSFATVFADGREATKDRRGFLNVVFDGAVGRGWSGTARLAYDYYNYTGTYPYDYGDFGTIVSEDRSDSHTVSGELTARRRIGRSHLFTVGSELRHQLHAHQRYVDEFETLLDVNEPGAIVGVYAQDEMRVTRWLLLNGGVRLDRYPSFGSHVAPRIAVVLLPRSQTSVKVLYGQAFRAPNPYELYYYDVMRGGDATVEPENIRSTEVVWEEYVFKHVHRRPTHRTAQHRQR